MFISLDPDVSLVSSEVNNDDPYRQTIVGHNCESVASTKPMAAPM